MIKILESLNENNELVKRKPNFVMGIISNESVLDENTYYLFEAVISTTISDDIIASKLFTAKKQGHAANLLFDFDFGQLKNKKWIGVLKSFTYQQISKEVDESQ